jgi:hypothetical protein
MATKNKWLCAEGHIANKINIEGTWLEEASNNTHVVDCDFCEDFHNLENCKEVKIELV